MNNINLIDIRNKITLGIPITSIPLKVTYYSRVSTDHNDQLNSLNNQSTYFTNYIKQNKEWTYIPGYIEQGISGTTDYKREQFMNMINDAKQNKFDLIITKEISRFSRNTLDSIKYTRELLTYGVAVLFINDNINTLLPDSELRLTIMASMAQDEIRRLSERVKFGINRSIEKGILLGNNTLYGYNKINNKLHIKKEEAIIVKQLYNLYTYHNLSLSKITKIFNEQQIPTNKNNKWTITTLSRMIKNPKYKGYYCAKKTEVIDYINKKVKYNKQDKWLTYKDKNIPPIIDEKTWDLANKKLHKNPKTKKKNQYFFSNKIYCLNDSHPFHRRKQCTNDITWLCSNYLNNTKKSCITPNIREKEIYSILNSLLKLINYNNKDIITFLSKYYNPSIITYLNNNTNYINQITYNILLNKITTKLINNNILLNIYINFKHNNIHNQKYIFKRKQNTIKYIVNYIFIK